MRKGFELTTTRLASQGNSYSRLLVLGIGMLAGLTCFTCVYAKPASPEQLALLSNSANIAAIRAFNAPANGCFSFIVLGDNRSGDNVFSLLIAQINEYVTARSGSASPLFVLHTGDIVPNGKLSQWDNYAQLRALLKLPVVHVRGNHDIVSATGAQIYEKLVGPKDWAFDFGGCRIIGLDNATGRFSKESVSFLRGQLGLDTSTAAGSASNGGAPRHKFVLFHEPPGVGRWKVHCMASDSSGGRGGDVMSAIAQAKVSAVFMGHIHLFDEMPIDGIPYFISGGAGAPLYGQYGFGHAEHGFLVVHVSADNLTWDWVPLMQTSAEVSK